MFSFRWAIVKRQCKHGGRPHQLFIPSSFWDKITSILIPDDRDDDKNNADNDDHDHDDCDVDPVDDKSQLRICN